MLSLLKFLILIVIFFAADNAVAVNKSVEGALFDLSIEDLMQIEVTTVSRRSQKLSEVPSAVFVITQEDIQRSGATSIPDALRMAPGVQVERVSTDKWAVSIRGFNGVYANKLQVLMDGRSVYNPMFAGVQWEQQDTLLEDIERIEVIRGPAAAVWGANAVNGVINIITKQAADTQGSLLTAGGGSFEQGFFGARYGGKINEATPFRFYAKGFTRDRLTSTTGDNIHNQWHSARGGFRLDHTRGIDQFTLQGDIFYNAHGDTVDRSQLNLPGIPQNGSRGHTEGGNIRLRWDRVYSEQSAIMLQIYYDRNRYRLVPIGDSDAESFDVDFQHRLNFLEKHSVTWGLNYRLYHNTVFDSVISQFTPREQTNHQFGAFLRDEISLLPERLMLTIGTRLDHNDFSGLEVQPNARLMWTPNSSNSVWMSISRAVRIPSRAEQDVTAVVQQIQGLPGFPILPVPILATITGTNNFGSEKLIAYEVGYRHQITPRASVDIAGFVNDYSQLRDFSFGALSAGVGLPGQIRIPVTANNNASALTYGLEVSADWKPLNQWRLQASYSYLNMDIDSSELVKQLDPTTGGADKVAPQHRLSFRSNYDFSEKLQLNLWLRYVSKIAFYNIPDYVTMDARFSFKPVKHVELFLMGQNLFSQNHREFVSDTIPTLPGVIPRGIYAGVQWRF
ncbi:TonB-dependent receptor [Nitrosomonas sp.]|uniref:TonB-dependent receptor plug domain-containing protein n=1 Tax=Nitrosomonas sp. TaxID=42353 RepID=UPI001D32B95F|nr:TonB-dependent receptor [Nitrosomonas sp.]MCB1949322.1 TonB-dependent receptor [Nitrosomonas sp.]